MDRGKGLFVFGCGRICVLSHKQLPQSITRKSARLKALLKEERVIWGLGVVIPCYHDNF